MIAVEAAASAEPLEWFEERGQVRDGPVPYGGGVLEVLRAALAPRGIEIRDVHLSTADFDRFVSAADYENRASYYGSFVTEKKLEHFAAGALLDPGPGDVFVDVGAANSPAAEIYGAIYGCAAYVQDIEYADRIEGNRIGGDAGRMPVPAGFASRISLHCAFEHFEGDADVRFVREVARILRPGGKCLILPLYVSPEYAIQTDPEIARREGVRFETDALVFRTAGWSQRHGRFYDPSRLVSRLLANASDLRPTLVHFVNEKDFAADCYLKFGLLLEKPVAAAELP